MATIRKRGSRAVVALDSQAHDIQQVAQAIAGVI
jgi:hypothetical protein